MDEEIDEESAFNASDKAKYGGWFETDEALDEFDEDEEEVGYHQ